MAVAVGWWWDRVPVGSSDERRAGALCPGPEEVRLCRFSSLRAEPYFLG